MSGQPEKRMTHCYFSHAGTAPAWAVGTKRARRVIDRTQGTRTWPRRELNGRPSDADIRVWTRRAFAVLFQCLRCDWPPPALAGSVQPCRTWSARLACSCLTDMIPLPIVGYVLAGRQGQPRPPTRCRRPVITRLPARGRGTPMPTQRCLPHSVQGARVRRCGGRGSNRQAAVVIEPTIGVPGCGELTQSSAFSTRRRHGASGRAVRRIASRQHTGNRI